MAFFTTLDEQVTALGGLLGVDAIAETLTTTMSFLNDDELVAAIGHASALARNAEKISIVGAGIVAARSRRTAGHSGLAQSHGHRGAAELLQEITGSSKAEAHKQVRTGESLLNQNREDRTGVDVGVTGSDASEMAPDSATGETGADDTQTDSEDGTGTTLPWHAPLGVALMAGVISSTQHDAILRNLGVPTDDSPATKDAWCLGVEQLILEAAERTVEELRGTARMIRDRLDPDGAARRFEERYQRRSFRIWTDQDGCRRGSFSFEDEGYAWIDTIMNAALRPRRGGPRFVDSEEKAAAEKLAADPRTNDQLSYDLIMDVIRAGALADAEAVFGTRQAGVRLVHVVDASGDAASTAHTEDGLVTLPGWVAEQHACTTSTSIVTMDECGNPLDVGRERRLFTSKQRLALSLRDGGCRWRNCDRPASYCEAHHSTHWADGGRTDIDDGILLCRYHHMALHHGGWRITRSDDSDFFLHPPGGGPPVVLKPRLALTYAWAGIDPPPRRFRVA